MSASSHFMIPVSVAASRPRRDPRQVSRISQTTDWEEFDGARRRASLLALLAIYTVGLALVIMLYQGEDIGVLLSAFFAHALLTAIRGVLAARRVVAIRTRLGTLIVHSRARLVPIRA